MIEKAKALLAEGSVNRVLAWEKGENDFDRTPAVFDANSVDNLVYDGLCGANLSKYLIQECAKDGKTLVFLKPCDSWSYNQLATEHRIDPEKIVPVAVGCRGKIDVEKLREKGLKGILEVTDGESI